MKKIILLVSFMSVAAVAFSQDFKPFRVGLGLGYASPGGSGAKGGVLLYLEPSYRLTDAFAIGLRIESAVMARGTVTQGGNTSTFDGTVSANGSYTVNGQYYFSNGGFRPFVGLGLGFIPSRQRTSPLSARVTSQVPHRRMPFLAAQNSAFIQG